MDVKKTLMACALIGAALWLLGFQSRARAADSGGVLIRQININHLALPGQFKPSRVSIKRDSVRYEGNSAPSPVRDIYAAVFPSVVEAEKAFQRWTTWPLRNIRLRRIPNDGKQTDLSPNTPLKIPKIGDQFGGEFGYPNIRSFDYSRPKGKGLDIGYFSRIVLRRQNVLISFCYAGKDADAVSLAQRIDQQILYDATVAPRGDSLQIPTVNFTAPATAIGGRRLLVHLNCPDSNGVRMSDLKADGVYSQNGDYPLIKQGKFWIYAPNKAGRVTVPIRMVSEGNVFFTKNLTLNVTTKEQFEATRRFRLWPVPAHALYFFQTATEKVKTVNNLFTKEQEWFRYGPFYVGPVYDAEKRQKLKAQALSEWKNCIKTQWLPEDDLLNTAYIDPRPANRYVAYATYQGQGSRCVLWGELGGEFCYYIEQSLPLAKGAKLLQIEHITVPGAAVLSQNFERYRAFDPNKGKREKVHILLLRFPVSDANREKSPDEQVNLRFPGFLGKLMAE